MLTTALSFYTLLKVKVDLHFLSMAICYSSVGLYHRLFIHFPVNEHLLC